MRSCLHLLLVLLATMPLRGQAGEDYLNAPDRIEWTGGALYDGEFTDGTRFRMELGYPYPKERGGAAGTKFHPAYWYPKFYQGTRIWLSGFEYAGNPMRLVRAVPEKCNCTRDDEFFTLDLSPDLAAGQGHWTSASLHKALDFTLQRTIVYKSVLVRRPFRNRVTQREEAGFPFEFSAVFPVVGDPAVDGWIREQAGSCEYDRNCLNRVRVTWKSDTLLSIDASVWGYRNDSLHSEGVERTRHYRIEDGHLVPLDFASFIKPDRACRARMSKAIVGALRAQKVPWAAKAGLKDGREPAFTATPTGIAFHFNDSDINGGTDDDSTAFVPLAPDDPCVRFLPAHDGR